MAGGKLQALASDLASEEAGASVFAGAVVADSGSAAFSTEGGVCGSAVAAGVAGASSAGSLERLSDTGTLSPVNA